MINFNTNSVCDHNQTQGGFSFIYLFASLQYLSKKKSYYIVGNILMVSVIVAVMVSNVSLHLSAILPFAKLHITLHVRDN